MNTASNFGASAHTSEWAKSDGSLDSANLSHSVAAHSTGSSPLDPGSFRDRTNRIFHHNGEVYRALNGVAAAEWRRVSSTKFFSESVAHGRIISTQEVALNSLPADLLAETGQAWEAIVRHRRVPVISYPYEWSFSMLRDAALLQLDLLLAALNEDFSLKDSTPYNVQWFGSRPVFIDTGSFYRLPPGEPWVGYRQFCEMYLAPLLLQAHRDISFHNLLRGNLEGVPLEIAARIFSARDWLRAGVAKHIVLHSKFQSSFANSSNNAKKELKDLGFHKELIVANVRSLRKLIAGLSWKRGSSEWSHYADKCPSYQDDDLKAKLSFVEAAAATKHRSIIWDIGCNTGTFSRLAAKYSDQVVSLDADHLAIDRLYQDLKRENNRSILPLVMNLADPSPGLGWRGRERSRLETRAKPDLTLCLALIHHVVISAHIPLPEFINWLASLGGDLVIEFVSREDPMVKKLLCNKDDYYSDYNRDVFERSLQHHYQITRQLEIAHGTRILYFATPRG